MNDSATLNEALARMIKHHMQQLLVVDAAGKFIGILSTFTLAKLLLPKGKEGDTQTQTEAELETLRDVDDRITPHLGRRVGDYADREVPVVHPDTPLVEALKLMAGGRLRLPVVDAQTGKLVGVISPLTVLRRYQF